MTIFTHCSFEARRMGSYIEVRCKEHPTEVFMFCPRELASALHVKDIAWTPLECSEKHG